MILIELIYGVAHTHAHRRHVHGKPQGLLDVPRLRLGSRQRGELCRQISAKTRQVSYIQPRLVVLGIHVDICIPHVHVGSVAFLALEVTDGALES